VPPESDSVTTFAPMSSAFSVAYCATLPEPETVQTLPFIESPMWSSMFWAKYSVP
jgi:hypothetical protein